MQQDVPHEVIPAVQPALHAVPAELQPVDEHVVLVGVGHPPLLSQTCAAVCVPLVQVWAAPQEVPASLLPVDTQTCLPVVHEYVPFLHPVVSGEHEPPAAQDTQAPALHTIPPVPQGVPFASMPVSAHARDPVLHEPETVWHATCVHEFGLQVTQAPPLHTIPPDPQDVPLATIPVSLQTSAPVLQEPETVWHAAAVHEVGLQPVQTPLPLHTMLVPQGVATGLFPVSMQTAAPVVQEFVPVLH